MSYLNLALATGLVATMTMDIWGYARKPILGIPAADYRWVGRWVCHMARGRFRHQSIAAAAYVRGELLVGWIAHYLLGVAFAAGFLAVIGAEWARRPTLLPALAFGLSTAAVPFLIMQPAMGMGVAASHAPRPAAARVQSLATHLVFGVGLYLGAVVCRYCLSL